jgi:cell division septal protein FtsQ
MRSVWIKAIILLAVVWSVVGGVMWWARSQKPTPDRLLAYVETHPIDGKPSSDRARIIEKVAKQLNGLSYEERRNLRISRQLDGFFRRLNADEQTRFLDLTLPEGFKQMMEALNNMGPEKRKKFVERTLNDMKRQEGLEGSDEARERFVDDRNTQKIIDQGLKSFYSEASAETKMDVAPILEQMQRNLQGFGR